MRTIPKDSPSRLGAQYTSTDRRKAALLRLGELAEQRDVRGEVLADQSRTASGSPRPAMSSCAPGCRRTTVRMASSSTGRPLRGSS
jgi:hypothetical protein